MILTPHASSVPTAEAGTLVLVIIRLIFLAPATVSSVKTIILTVLPALLASGILRLKLYKEDVVSTFQTRERAAYPGVATTYSDAVLDSINR